ncbi:MAG TPA: hypothetical protein VMB20_07015 [Candidatus Acidoferrum sp.]|nr:hypothetical protein [Candidatus Acidoferrum sp.]
MSKFICIDDDPGTEALLRRLREAGLDVELRAPKPVDQQFKELASDKYDGLILDLRLDEQQNEGYKADYFSNLPARFVRDLAFSKSGRDVPVVMLSGTNNLREFYRPDFASHDLYDAKYDKADVPDRAAVIAAELASLVEAYGRVSSARSNKQQGFLEMLGTAEDGHFVDARIGDKFLSVDAPVHEYVRYIKTEIIDQPYPLVSEQLLAARLGVDTESRGWQALLAKLEPFKYTGILCDAWPRWWWDSVSAWLKENLPESRFQQITAAERIELIGSLGLEDLHSAAPIEPGYLTRFWGMCDVLKRPVDPANAFVSNQTSSQPWHDPRYISFKAAFDREDEQITVHATERQRFESLLSQE